MKPQDFDRISAYIDDQLSPAEKAALEAQLARDAELRAALQELRMTVRALRTLPPVKPPRNFTLTPAQVGAAAGGHARRRAPLFPGLRLAAALSALALAVVVAGDFAGSGGLRAAATTGGDGATITTLSVTNQVALAPAPVTETAEAATAQTEALPAASQIFVPSVGSGADTSATPGVASAAGLAATPTETASGARTAEATPSLETKSMAAIAPSETPTTLDTAPPAATAAAPEATAAQTDAYAAGNQATAPGPGLSPLRVAEAALAMLTVMLGLAAWFTRRNA